MRGSIVALGLSALVACTGTSSPSEAGPTPARGPANRIAPDRDPPTTAECEVTLTVFEAPGVPVVGESSVSYEDAESRAWDAACRSVGVAADSCVDSPEIEIRSRRSSSSMQMVNGVTTREVQVAWEVSRVAARHEHGASLAGSFAEACARAEREICEKVFHRAECPNEVSRVRRPDRPHADDPFAPRPPAPAPP